MRGLAAAKMYNKAGVLVQASATTYASALNNYLAYTQAPQFGGIILSISLYRYHHYFLFFL
jgi:hypothetical protein